MDTADDKSDGPNFNEFMVLVAQYRDAVGAYDVATYESNDPRKWARLRRKAEALYARIADAAARRFPGGRDYQG